MLPLARLVALDGLRGLSALIVVLYHLVWIAGFRQGETAAPPAEIALCTLGHFAVLVFFALSGFVIGHTTPLAFTRANLKEYGARRFIRIYPVYLAGLALAYAVDPSQLTVPSLVHHLTLSHVYFEDTVSSNGPLWTLHYEAVFYLLFVAVWFLRLAPGAVVVGLALASSLFFVSGAYILTVAVYFAMWCVGLWVSRAAPAAERAGSSALGAAAMCLTANAFYWGSPLGPLLHDYAPPVPAMDARGLPGHPFQDVIMAIPVAAIIAQLVGKRVPGAWAVTAAMWLASAVPVALALRHGGAPAMVWLAAAYLAAAALAAACAFFVRVDLSRPLSRLKWAGDLSYGLYVTHLPITLLGLSAVGPHTSGWKVWAAGAGCFAASLAAGYLLEERFHRGAAAMLKPLLLPSRGGTTVAGTA
jgi:peptidoglycan/LPS O-acetylase OafA/YrhL